MTRISSPPRDQIQAQVALMSDEQLAYSFEQARITQRAANKTMYQIRREQKQRRKKRNAQHERNEQPAHRP